MGIEENGSAEPTHDDGDFSEGDTAPPDLKDEMYDSDEENTVIIIEPCNFENYHHRETDINDVDSRRVVANNSGRIGGHRENEEEPLVDGKCCKVV